MQAQLDKIGEVTVIRLIGQVDLETHANFRKICLSRFLNDRVVFHLSELKFVGSTGLQLLLKTLNDMNSGNPYRIRLSGVSSELNRMIQFVNPSGLNVHESIENAIQSFYITPTIEESFVSDDTLANVNSIQGLTFQEPKD